MDSVDILLAEKAVLGGILLGPDPADEADVLAMLSPETFQSKAAGIIYGAMQAIIADGNALDEVSLSKKLGESGRLSDIGGDTAIAGLIDGVPTAANILHHAEIVAEAARARLFERAIYAMAKDTRPVRERIQELMPMMHGLLDGSTKAQVTGVDHEMKTLAAHLISMAENKTESTGLPTGFTELDEILGGGMQAGELLVVAGRPSMGKTAFAMDLAWKASLAPTSSVLVVSLEMSSRQLASRYISSVGRVESRDLRSPMKIKQADWARIANLTKRAPSGMRIIDKSWMTVEDIRAKARTIKSKHGLNLIVIDYLQLVRASSNGRNNREREVAEMSCALKGLAKEMDVPVICLAQLNRGVESRDDKKPRLSDLRESGAVEQDADVVMMLHRQGYYDKDADNDEAEVIVAKNRNGPTGVAKVGWCGEFSSFTDLKGPVF